MREERNLLELYLPRETRVSDEDIKKEEKKEEEEEEIKSITVRRSKRLRARRR